MEAAERLENFINCQGAKENLWGKILYHRFSIKDGYGYSIHKIFSNHRCRGFYASPELTGDAVNHFDIKAPEPGFMVIAEINYRKIRVDDSLRKFTTHHLGCAAFFFDGKLWQRWLRPPDVQVYSGNENDLQIAITGPRDKELVRVSSLGHNHELVTFEHVLDYCAGKRSLADILALVEMEERLRLRKERQTVYAQLLPLARKLKGAVRSSTGAEIEKLVLGLIQK